MTTMAKYATDDDVPQAVLEWRAAEAKWHTEAMAWAEARLDEIINSDDGYTLRTAAEYLRLLDTDKAQTSAWARINKSDKASYDERYHIVRNHLERRAKSKTVVCGTAVNRNGIEGVSTYGRPRDITAEWDIEIQGGDVRSIRTDLVNYLTTSGTKLEGAELVTLRRKTPGVTYSGQSADFSNARPASTRRRHRPTRGGG